MKAADIGRKYVFPFGGGAEATDAHPGMRPVLGARGAILADLASAGLPVPPGFTVSTEACAYFVRHHAKLPPGLTEQVRAAVDRVQGILGRKFGDGDKPLLFSLRSGAAIAMPGLMDPILNLGMNPRAIRGLARQTGHTRTAWDCYRRLVETFSPAVMGPRTGLSRHDFDVERKRLLEKYGLRLAAALSAAQLEELCRIYERTYREKVGRSFPQDPWEQLDLAIRAAFIAWSSSLAQSYRQSHKVAGLLGTATQLCAMVFGNAGPDSGCGTASTRDGATGEATPVGSYLVDAQGTDLTPDHKAFLKPLKNMATEADQAWARAHAELGEVMLKLERQYGHPQELEFTVEHGKVWILQTRPARRSGLAGLRWAVEMATGRDIETGRSQARTLTPRQALLAISGDDLEHVFCPAINLSALAEAPALATGQPAGHGAASGRVVFDARDAQDQLRRNPAEKLILVRPEFGPQDLVGMAAAQGLVASSVEMASWTAAMARGWGTCCIVGARELNIDPVRKTVSAGSHVVRPGDWISLDGSTGHIYKGRIPCSPSPVVSAVVDHNQEAMEHPAYRMYRQLLDWCDAIRKTRVRATLGAPRDLIIARAFGAEGIGRCCMEHLLLADACLPHVRDFILAPDKTGRENALSALLPLLRGAVEGIFAAMKGLPVTVRLLDEPLREFLPQVESDMKDSARRLNVSVETVRERVRQLQSSARLGHRGGLHFVSCPELMALQTAAIMEAACNVEKKRLGVLPEILLPRVLTKASFEAGHGLVRKVADDVLRKRRSKLKYLVGASIDSPRAALTADQIAETAEFLCFAAGDLTRHTFGFDREDIAALVPDYLAQRLLPADPFLCFDAGGVGQLVETAVRKARETRPELACGLCVDYAGDPASMRFLLKAGLSYISCPPSRIPFARLTAAQAALKG
jgi:pyruvate, orthophosphate dikinase